MIKIISFAIAATLLAIPAASTARVDRIERESNGVETGDPTRVVCRSESETGTRLGRSKRCLTAGQWADMKQSSRQVVERVQAQSFKVYEQN